ncbi:MAG: amidohydrolase family protein, partial [Gemmatimonadota bacterium]
MSRLVRLLMLFSVPGCSVQAQSRAADPGFTLTNVTVIDVRGGPSKPGMAVTVAGGRITRIGPSGALGRTGGRRIDASGKFLIPGLWDMHVHLEFGDWFPRAHDISLPLFIANGVTGVRDMGSEWKTVVTWRRAIDAGTLTGPRIVSPGPMLDGPEPRFPSSVAIKTPEDGRRAVRDLKRHGVDFIKLQSLIPREAVFAIADEAKKQNIVFAGHVPDAVRAREASAAGQKSFEHLIGIFEGSSPAEDEFLKGPKGIGRFLATYDPSRAAQLFQLLAKNKTWQCPTLVWERGGTLLDQRDLAHDPLGRYAPASWKNGAWKRFNEEIVRGYSDDLATRRKFVAKELEVVGALHRAGVP